MIGVCACKGNRKPWHVVFQVEYLVLNHVDNGHTFRKIFRKNRKIDFRRQKSVIKSAGEPVRRLAGSKIKESQVHFLSGKYVENGGSDPG